MPLAITWTDFIRGVSSENLISSVLGTDYSIGSHTWKLQRVNLKYSYYIIKVKLCEANDVLILT